ncbi:MAG: CoA ester lyase [Hyphomonadaceae bacterium]
MANPEAGSGGEAARPRRSALYMPGANAKAMDKARTLPADTLLFDLEDAVAPEAKVGARDAFAAALQAGGYGRREIVVRVNALATEWGRDDVKAAAAAKPDAVLFPKIESAAQAAEADRALSEAGASERTALWAMIETPLAILDIKEIAAAARATRLKAFVIGTNDLAKETGALQTPAREAFLPSLVFCVLAARAYGLAVLDGVYNDIADAAGFEASCRQGLALGFDGKTLIHPSQIEPCNAVFTPPESDVAHARDVIAAFAAPENAGKGVLKVNGKMTELLHLAQARRLVGMDRAIKAMAG